MTTLHLLAAEPGGISRTTDILVRIELAQGVRLVRAGTVYLAGEIVSVSAELSNKREASGWCAFASVSDVPSALAATVTDEIVVYEVVTPVVFHPGVVSILRIPTIQGP